MIEKVWLEVYGEPVNIFGYPESFVFDQAKETLFVDFPYLFESEDVFNIETLYCIVLGLNYVIKRDFEINQVFDVVLSQKPASISNYVKKKSALVSDRENRAWTVDSGGKFQEGLSIVENVTGKNQVVLDYVEQVISDFSPNLKNRHIKLRSKVRYYNWIEELSKKPPLVVTVNVITSTDGQRQIESYRGIVTPIDRSRVLDPVQTLQLKNVELINKIDL